MYLPQKESKYFEKAKCMENPNINICWKCQVSSASEIHKKRTISILSKTGFA